MNDENSVEKIDIDNIDEALKGKSIKEIRDIIDSLGIHLEQRKLQEIKKKYADMLKIAVESGFNSIEDFLTYIEENNIKVSTRSQKGKKKSEPKQRKVPFVPYVYRSKTNPTDTWTGRGKQPRWLVSLLESGESLDNLRISQEEIDQQIENYNSKLNEQAKAETEAETQTEATA
jgi:DNA-binding protein H-NS